jgi:hypothetical protein
MDRYTKTVLTVIAGCLLVLVGGQIDFPSKAYAVSTSSIGGDKAGGTAVTDDGMVYFMTTNLDIIYCYRSDCKKVYED